MAAPTKGLMATVVLAAAFASAAAGRGLLKDAEDDGGLPPIPSTTFTPPVTTRRPPGVFDNFPAVPAFALVTPGTPGYPDQGWRETVPERVYANYTELVTDPALLEFFGNTTLPLPVASLYMTQPDALAGGTLAYVNQTEALLPDYVASRLAEEGELDALVASLTDPDEAEAHFWQLLSDPAAGGQPFQLFTLLKAVDDDPETFDAFLAAFSAGDNDGAVVTDDAVEGWRQLAAEGRLYVMDAGASRVLAPRDGPSSPIFTLGAVVVLKQMRHSGDLRPVAVKLTSQDGGDVQHYTRDSATGSAWAQSLYFSLVALNTWGTWSGHVLNLHILPAAMTWTLRNNVAPEHPLRLFLDPRLNNNVEFLTLLAVPDSPVLGATPTPASSILDVLALNQAYLDTGYLANHAFPRDYEPVRVAQRNGVRAKAFGGRGKGKAGWEKFPMVAVQQKMWDFAEETAAVFVDAAYASNKAVREDVQLAAWIADAADPAMGNVAGLVAPGNRKELAELLTFLVYTPLAHTLTNSMAANGQIFHTSNFPAAVTAAALPDPAAIYTPEGLLSDGVLPDAWQLQRLATFYGTFLLGGIQTNLVPDLDDFSKSLFFPMLPASSPVNKAQAKLRKNMVKLVEEYLEEWNPGHCESFAAAGLGDFQACLEQEVSQLSVDTAW